MGKDMTYWLFIGMFQGLVDQIKLFRKEKQAIKSFNDYTSLDWDELTFDEQLCEELEDGDYSGSQILELQIEA